jgi:hypothetical protein
VADNFREFPARKSRVHRRFYGDIREGLECALGPGTVFNEGTVYCMEGTTHFIEFHPWDLASKKAQERRTESSAAAGQKGNFLAEVYVE